MGSKIKVGEIVRLTAGYTPMVVMMIDDENFAYCNYCGDARVAGCYDDATYDKRRHCTGFVTITDPDKELKLCLDWVERLNSEQYEQLDIQRKRKRKGKSTMKTRTELLNIAALTSNEVTTVVVLLDGSRGTKGLYTFLAKRSLAESITEEDQQVVVETKHGLTIGIVKEIHTEVTVETMDEYRMRWAFMKVANDHLTQLNTWQEQVADKLNTAQRRVTKQSALQALGLGDDEVAALPALSPPAETTTE